MLHGFPVIRTGSLNLDGSLVLSPTLPLVARRLHRRAPLRHHPSALPDPMSHLALHGRCILYSTHHQLARRYLRHKLLMHPYRRVLERSVNSAARSSSPHRSYQQFSHTERAS
jgi:hypothetical protein